jgi:formylglycine-generating enzyme required for sulfatase activity
MNCPLKSGFIIIFCLAIFMGCGGGGGGGDDDNDPICTDTDADGYFAESGCGTLVDCNDNAANVNPGATETCNGVDDNCSGAVDEGVTNTYYQDGDSDTYGNAVVSTQACSVPAGYVSNSTDCDDSAAGVNPGATETCNGVDDNCSGAVDEGVTNTYYQDGDGDTYGNAAVSTQACSAPGGYVSDSSDCDDTTAGINPGATEIPDDLMDQDCDGFDLRTWYLDNDGDGYGDIASTTTANSQPSGYVLNSSDCNDSAANENPGETEVCNGVDDNCSGAVDEGVTNTYYQDGDNDTYGNTAVSTQACSLPAGYVSDNTDCDDAVGSVYPGATETCGDGIDQDCNGGDLSCDAVDDDGDGLSDIDGDCDDTDDTIYPGATEVVDDGIDQNCDGFDLITWYLDSDGDGYGDPASTTTANENAQPLGYVADNTDCDDSVGAAYPGNTEICNDGLDNDCNTFTDCDDATCTDHPVCNTFTNSLGMTFHLISSGTYTMGSPGDESGRGTDEDETDVTLTQDFYMQTTEVTQGQWTAVTSMSPSYFSNCGGDCPVETVSWNDVQSFIADLNVLGEGTYRLPTEAEWEYAARAGSVTAFANGDITATSCAEDVNLTVMGWYCFNSGVAYAGCFNLSGSGGSSCAGTNPVKGKIANTWGLYDMHGNLWEWCQDGYAPYPPYPPGQSTLTDPVGSGTENVIRGGSWAASPASCRSANRNSLAPTIPGIDIGFRLVRQP